MNDRILWRTAVLSMVLAGGLILTSCGKRGDLSRPTADISPSVQVVQLLKAPDSITRPNLIVPV